MKRRLARHIAATVNLSGPILGLCGAVVRHEDAPWIDRDCKPCAKRKHNMDLHAAWLARTHESAAPLRALALEARCPWPDCAADPGTPCRDANGPPRRWARHEVAGYSGQHVDRVRLAMKLRRFRGQPVPALSYCARRASPEGRG